MSCPPASPAGPTFGGFSAAPSPLRMGSLVGRITYPGVSSPLVSSTSVPSMRGNCVIPGSTSERVFGYSFHAQPLVCRLASYQRTYDNTIGGKCGGSALTSAFSTRVEDLRPTSANKDATGMGKSPGAEGRGISRSIRSLQYPAFGGAFRPVTSAAASPSRREKIGEDARLQRSCGGSANYTSAGAPSPPVLFPLGGQSEQPCGQAVGDRARSATKDGISRHSTNSLQRQRIVSARECSQDVPNSGMRPAMPDENKIGAPSGTPTTRTPLASGEQQKARFALKVDLEIEREALEVEQYFESLKDKVREQAAKQRRMLHEQAADIIRNRLEEHAKMEAEEREKEEDLVEWAFRTKLVISSKPEMGDKLKSVSFPVSMAKQEALLKKLNYLGVPVFGISTDKNGDVTSSEEDESDEDASVPERVEEAGCFVWFARWFGWRRTRSQGLLDTPKRAGVFFMSATIGTSEHRAPHDFV